MPTSLTLRIIRYRLMVSGAIQGKEYRPPLHLSVVAIQKGAFGLPSTNVSQDHIGSIILELKPHIAINSFMLSYLS